MHFPSIALAVSISVILKLSGANKWQKSRVIHYTFFFFISHCMFTLEYCVLYSILVAVWTSVQHFDDITQLNHAIFI